MPHYEVYMVGKKRKVCSRYLLCTNAPHTRAHIYGSHSPAFSLCDPLIEPMGGHNNYGESGGSKILVWIHMYAELPSPKYHNPMIHGPQVQQF